jgi:ATP/maltotriose-dependent transcriptional regulator MalT
MTATAAGLLEREAAMDAAARLLGHAAAGQGGTLVILAEPGLGKTSVLDAVCRNAKNEFSIGLARGDAMETALPFGLLSQALFALGCDVLDGQGYEPSGPDRRASTFYAARRWLEQSAPRPALIALDDAHWSDADSMALLSFLCRRIAALPVAVIATLRPWPASARLTAEALSHDGYASIEHLEPLTRSATAALLAQHARRRLDDAEVERASELCTGNPLLLEQVALAVARGEEIPRGEAGEMRGIHDRLLLARFAGLPAAGMACARAGAVFGAHFRPDLAVCLADVSQRDGDEALDALERGGLLQPGQRGRTEFTHPLFRQALYDDLSGSVRARLHARAFALLAERGLEEEAVEHAIKADLAGHQAAIALLYRVGRAARGKGAAASAMTVLESAVALAGDNASHELLCDLAEALATTGRPADAVGVCERIQRLADVPVMITARTLQALARAHVYLGDFAAAAQRVDECVSLTETVAPEVAIEVLLHYTRVAYFLAGPPAALQVLDRAMMIARACDARLGWSAEVARALAALDSGDPSGLEAARVAAVLAEAACSTTSGRALAVASGAIVSFATIAKYTDRLAESEHFYRLRLRITEQLGSVDEEAVALYGYFGTLLRMLRLGDAAAVIERCAKLIDLVPLVAPYNAVDRATLYLMAGRLTESGEAAGQAEAMVTAFGGWQSSLNLDYGRGWRCLAEGRLAEACDLYSRIETVSARVGLREPCEVPWARHGIAAYLGAGRREDAERVLGWLEGSAAHLPCVWPRIAAAHGRALLAEAAGDQAAADGLFQQAMAMHDEVDLPLEWLQTQLEYGRFLRRSGQLLRARPLLAKAAELAESTGALWLAGQANDELRVAGGRRREKPDPDLLTPAEQRVAALAASGASNAEVAAALYLSVNTVETHLQHAFAKLGIRSRRQLPAALAGRGTT